MKILSFGGGLQTTAIVILAFQGKIEFDEVIFADTCCEKPETYNYIENYIKPILKVPFKIVTSHHGNMYDWYFGLKQIPSVRFRMCTDVFKVRPMKKNTSKDDEILIGVSADESHRVGEQSHQNRKFPLIELGITRLGCNDIIRDFGWPIPIKSACYICPFQRWNIWNWLKLHHPELFQRAVDLESNSYKRRPQDRETFGLFGGKPLWKFQQGIQYEFGFPEEYSCWSGHCGH